MATVAAIVRVNMVGRSRHYGPSRDRSGAGAIGHSPRSNARNLALRTDIQINYLIRAYPEVFEYLPAVISLAHNVGKKHSWSTYDTELKALA